MALKQLSAIACLCFFTSLLHAQTKPEIPTPPRDYDAKWKKVDSLVYQKGLTQSALSETDKIYTLAAGEKNEAQMIKALLYRASLRDNAELDAIQKNIKELEREIGLAPQPGRSILENLLAGVYWNYFQQNRYRFYNRTKTVNYLKDDITTWDASEFHKKIGGLFLSSLREEKLLQQTKTESYAPILIRGNAGILRPSLFDLLAHNALNYFKTDERDINKPAFAFVIDDTVAFTDAAVFVRHLFTTDDSLSLHFKTLKLFQHLIGYHLADPKPDALLDVDIERLDFVKQYAVTEEKESLYLKALVHLTDRYGTDPAAAEAWYLQASEYAQKAAGYQPAGDTAHRYDYLTAKAICDKVLAEKDSSEGRSNCAMLLQNILQKSLGIETEKINIPGQPLRGLLTWRNFSQISMRLIRLEPDYTGKKLAGRTIWDKDYWGKILQLPVLQSWSQALPETGDYQLHRTEIKIGALPPGEYALLASIDPAFGTARNVMTVQYFYVSSIAYINNDRDYFVLDRETGKPMAGAAVQVWNREYNKTGGFDLTKKAAYQADGHGHVQMAQRAYGNNYPQEVLEITVPGDHLFLRDQNLEQYYRSDDEEIITDKLSFEKEQARTWFFTDRSIYRPGQTVYFKGIVVTRDAGTHRPKVSYPFTTRVTLYNANDEKVDSLQLTTNEYGSYQGRFRLPENLLNGRWSIKDDSTDISQEFSVEEYKRPAFYVDYEKLKGSYRVGDSIRVTGNAKAYAGNLIDGAGVKYRVVRQARYPYPWLFGRWAMPVSREQEIAHGEIKTGADGTFVIAFAALADRSIPRNLDPVFEYNVSADVTDINGETRSGETGMKAGYKALELSIVLPGDHLPADSLRDLTIKTTNLSGEPERAKVHLMIYALKSPNRLIRERLWPEPDQFVMGEKEYLGLFPHDEYSSETKKESWQRGELLFETRDPLVKLPPGLLKPGWYVIEVTAQDRYGQDIKDVKYIDLYDSRTGQPATPQYNWTRGQVVTAEPGGEAHVDAGSSAGDVFVIRKTERNDGSGKIAAALSYFTLTGGRKETGFAVTESDRGGFGVDNAFVKDNRLYSGHSVVQVPYTNKELTIHYTTFRDMTLPGSAEKWQVQISGHKGGQIAAEVMAGMYDASLDQFRPQSWSKPDIFPLYSPQGSWQTGWNFLAQPGQERSFYTEVYEKFYKQYDQLLDLRRYQPYASRRPMLMRSSPKAGLVPGLALSSSNLNEAVVSDEADKAMEPGNNKEVIIRGKETLSWSNGVGTPLYVVDGVVLSPAEAQSIQAGEIQSINILKDAAATAIYGSKGANGVIVITTKKGGVKAPQPEVQVRKNFSETAFFFPDLRTDSLGKVSFSFTMPESLTRWKWMTLAHTRDLAFGYDEKTIVTQKQLMVQPNAPRFLREGDRMELSAKVVNLTDSELTGQVELQLTDPTTGETADGWFSNRQANQYFTVSARQSTAVTFSIEIPYQYNRPLTYRFVARALLPAKATGAAREEVSDGEEAILPVVSNRMLVTESLPLNMSGDGTRSFHFEKLLQSGNSETLSQHAVTVEFTGNPAWYAVQALPYLAEYPYACAEQTFNRFYANALAGKIANSSPRIRQIFDSWKKADTAALLSNLEKDPELKSVLLEETPWVLQGKSESQQKKNIALLFDMNRMGRELGAALTRLEGMQSVDGGFAWFKGGRGDRYITQYILTGIGHLQKLNSLPPAMAERIKAIVSAALPYLDKRIKEDYEEWKKLNKPASAAENRATGWIGELPVQYLYMRSMFSDYGIPGDVFPAVNFYRKQAQQLWVQGNKYMQGMIALALYRTGDVRTAKDILASLRQNAIHDEEKGMYWKGMEGGYYWYQAPVETQSLLIEAFQEISPDAKTEGSLKTWLLNQKQTQNWTTTKATADACYALLLGGGDWLSSERTIVIRLGDKTVSSDGGAGGNGPGTGKAGMGVPGAGAPGTNAGDADVHAEAGTGYFKKVFDGPFVNATMGNITVSMSTKDADGGTGDKSGSGAPAWGAVYWQYFENLDRITPPGGGKAPMKLVKKIFVERNTERGPVLEPVVENGTLKVGDKVKVRIELQVDRDLEYVHMKDMRAACMEPVNVLSGYKWQDGLGYYESTKDASTDFFFDQVRRGKYVFEYALFVGQTGNFSNGVTSIECMYAPEFSFHSEGIRVSVENPAPLVRGKDRWSDRGQRAPGNKRPAGQPHQR